MDNAASYPAPPWLLRGHAWLSAWAVPARELPAVDPGLTPVTVGGRGLVFAAWVDYDERGQLPYHELLLAVAISRGFGVAATITSIWVDSAASMHGARALWQIPKQLADFNFGFVGTGLTAEAKDQTGVLAAASFRNGPGLPLRVPARFSVYQGDAHCPVRVTGHPHPASLSWQPAPGSPLAFLAGRRPLASAHLRDFRMRFG